DGDGLNDGTEENANGGDPLLADTDGDGLNDGDEVNVHGTLVNNPDSDGDGWDDGLEVNTNGVRIKSAIREHAADAFSANDIDVIVRWCAKKAGALSDWRDSQDEAGSKLCFV
ncbi:MAG: hypothetical protein AAF385_17890, partial [Pseudomonadota bacterium]